MQKQDDKLTFKSSLNEQKYFFITFNMKKWHLFFIVAVFFSFQNQFSLYLVTKCRMFIEKCKTSFDNSNIMWTKYSLEVWKIIKIN